MSRRRRRRRGGGEEEEEEEKEEQEQEKEEEEEEKKKEKKKKNEWMNEWMIFFYVAHKKLPHKTFACSQRQIHTVHTCKLSQAIVIPKGTNSSYPPTPSHKWNYT